jgi:translation elongation factor EF-Tu-like GTPase
VCEGEHWRVTGIEMFRGGPLKTAEPGAEIGVLLRSCSTPDVLRGKTVQFVPKQGRVKDQQVGGRGFGRKLGRKQG